MKKNNTLKLTESAVMLAFATVLSLIHLLDLPYGGSVTLCSGVPLLMIAYRHGTPWGIFTAAVYGLLQMVLGMKNVMYFTTPLSIAAVVLLDYVFAFAALGLGGIFRRYYKKQTPALVLGALLASVVRYVLHTISGCTIWAGLSIPTGDALFYSLAYNATYMIPETIITLLSTALLARVLELRQDMVTRMRTEQGGTPWRILAASAVILATVAYDVQAVFRHLQDGETGDFLITGLQNVNWIGVLTVTACGALLSALLLLLKKRKRVQN